MMSPVQTTPTLPGSSLAPGRPVVPATPAPLDGFVGTAGGPSRQGFRWSVPVVAASTAASSGVGALAGFQVRLMGAWGIPVGLLAGGALGAAVLGGLAYTGNNRSQELVRLASLGAAVGAGAALAGGLAASFSSWPVLVGAGAGAVAGLAASGVLSARG